MCYLSNWLLLSTILRPMLFNLIFLLLLFRVFTGGERASFAVTGWGFDYAD